LAAASNLCRRFRPPLDAVVQWPGVKLATILQWRPRRALIAARRTSGVLR
jgi:hypothetical protein